MSICSMTSTTLSNGFSFLATTAISPGSLINRLAQGAASLIPSLDNKQISQLKGRTAYNIRSVLEQSEIETLQENAAKIAQIFTSVLFKSVAIVMTTRALSLISSFTPPSIIRTVIDTTIVAIAATILTTTFTIPPDSLDLHNPNEASSVYPFSDHKRTDYSPLNQDFRADSQSDPSQSLNSIRGNQVVIQTIG